MKKPPLALSSYENEQSKNKLGQSGEEHCVRLLQNEGYEILSQNFHSPYGEIDIIAKDGQNLVFIEVKTRTKDSVEHTKWNISYSKQKKITKTAMFFLMNFNNPEILEYRFDVMILRKCHHINSQIDAKTCQMSSAGGEQYHVEISHIKNAFLPAEVGDFFA